MPAARLYLNGTGRSKKPVQLTRYLVLSRLRANLKHFVDLMIRNKHPIWLQCLLYLWVSPISLCGLPLALMARLTGGNFTIHTGVLEIWGGRIGAWLDHGIPFMGAVNAFTLGHVVIGVSPDHLNHSRTHERVHVRQFERWGTLFPLIYLWAGWQAKRRGGHMYWDNPYEIEAREIASQS